MLPYEKPVDGRFGAPMGRYSDLSQTTTDKLHLRRVPLYEGCYDKGGAYWGGPANLWCAWNDAGARRWLRAQSREAAKAQLPDAKFYR